MGNKIFVLINEGKIGGFTEKPKLIETVISRVFIFDKENIVLKFYKRDNDWWNSDMKDISKGPSRIQFIRNDFKFNHFLNPKTYFALKTAQIVNGSVKLAESKSDDDELVIVMHKEDIARTFTSVLIKNTLTLDEYKNIGRTLAKVKISIPKDFLPGNKSNWYEQMKIRLQDLAGWVSNEKDFPSEVANKALELLNNELEKNKNKFQKINRNDLFVLIDCNSENLIYSDGNLRFIDAYSPKDDWQIGAFDVDVFRTGSDIYALAEQNAFDAYLEGVNEVAGNYLDKSHSDFYLLYGATIMAPYFFMRSKKDKKYLPIAKKYLRFIMKLLK
ncbi:MAG: hypothetical protein HY225_02965 [Candidatus Vogelbacteria bacterium]|nr:hypothetical protein [Candidatus Vogelbacteria bacterium]